MSQVTGYEYKSTTPGNPPAFISHEKYEDGGNVFIAFLPESNKTQSFHILDNAQKFLSENGFIINENVKKTTEIPAKTFKELNEEFSSIISKNQKIGRVVDDTPTRFASELIKKHKIGVSDAKAAQRRAIFDLSYNQNSPFKSEKLSRSFLDSEYGPRLASHYKNVVSHPEFHSMVRSFGFTPPSITESDDSQYISEATAPGMEDWVIANKKHFIDQYGKKKGLQVLYATAWKLHDKKIDEAYVIDKIHHPKYGDIVWKNECGYHTITTKNKETGAEVIHALGKNQEVADKWKKIKEQLLQESNEWVVSGGFNIIAESIAANLKE